MLERARVIYRQSKKRNDNFWTEWISRPPAALVVQALESTRVTPNQVTFVSLGAFALAAAVLCGWTDHAGLLVGALLMQLSYILDCADGQLARLKSLSSPAGALLDFLVDEIKAFLLVAALGVRLWQQAQSPLMSLVTRDDPFWLLVALGGLLVVSSGISITTFVRRPEYLGAIGAPPLAPATDRGGHAPRSLSPVALVEAAGRFVLHYPSWFPLIALVDRADLFLYAYLGAHTLYLGRASLTVLVKLGRSLPAAPAAPAAPAGPPSLPSPTSQAPR